MEGRSGRWIAVLVGVLLPVPLVGLVFYILFEVPKNTSAPRGPVPIPMLSPVEREGTPTYRRECRTDSDCDPRLRCFFSMVTASRYCVDSRCMIDEDCQDGFSCQTYTTWSGKELIKACSLAGPRKEGEVCSAFTRELEYACEKGLICHTRCGRPCDLGKPTTCPEGFFCEEALEGAACQPTCEGRACPQGQRCVALGGHRSVCAKVHGQDCNSVSCGLGQVCSVRAYPQSGHEVWMQCLQRCELKGTAPCPEETVCVMHGCRKSCAPDDPTACGEGFKCESLPGLPAICSPDVIASSAAQ